jgi:heme exporter protein A
MASQDQKYLKSASVPVALMARGLACRRGGRLVFSDLSFDVHEGQYLCLKGQNGSGKSTLLRLIAGLSPLHDGTLEFSGSESALKNSLILVGHQTGLKPGLSLRENSSLFHQVMTGQRLDAETLLVAAEAFSLTPYLDDPVQYFSSGQRHRASLMRLLLVPRRIWLMDEPTVGLDAENRQRLTICMQNHMADGGIIIAATHDPITLEAMDLNLDDYTGRTSLDTEGWL